MKTFRELIEESSLIESFDIINDYRKLSKIEMDNYWSKIVKSDNFDDLEKYIYKKYTNMICYIAKYQNREYFIYTFYKKLIYEIHFLDMVYTLPGEDYKNHRKTDNSQYIFSVIMSIVIDTIKNRSVQFIKISAPEHREELYLKIIKKVLKKYKITSNITIEKNQYQPGKDYIIELDWLKMTPENMIGEAMLELDGPDLLDGRIENIIKDCNEKDY